MSQTTIMPGQDVAAMQAELDRLRRREKEIAELLHSQSPDRIMHDLRNLLNELQLLRMLAETDQEP